MWNETNKNKKYHHKKQFFIISKNQNDSELVQVSCNNIIFRKLGIVILVDGNNDELIVQYVCLAQ